ncbi:DDIT4L family protein [Megaselia abdita]
MEVSVQNQFQGQYLIGASKKKDWRNSLTLPLTQNKTSCHKSIPSKRRQSQKHPSPKSISVSDSSQYNYNIVYNALDDSERTTAINTLCIRLQYELRAAKSRNLECTEVLLPDDLLSKISSEIYSLSEKEPCGIKGCAIYIDFEDESANSRRISSVKVDPNTLSTFELYLTIKQDVSGWHNILPQFLK